MQAEATQHIAKCPRCLKRKSTPQVAPLQPILVSQPLELVHLDYLTLEPSKGNIENVLVITDHFTRYALAYASKTQTAQATARILWDNFICHYGFPQQFIPDQGRNFESDLIQELYKIAGVKMLHTTPYHPQSNGQCERFNSTLCNMLGTLSDEEKSDWKSHLGCMTHAYNCTKHVSTTYSPYYLMFGRHPRLPIDVEFGLHKPNCSDNCSKSRYIQKLRRRLNYAHKKASKYSSEQAQKYKTRYDKSVKEPQLQVNDLVLVKIVAHKARHKIQDKWESEESSESDSSESISGSYLIPSGNKRFLCKVLTLVPVTGLTLYTGVPGMGCSSTYMSCISKTACFLVNCAPLFLQFGWNEEPKGLNGSRPLECDYRTPPSKSDTAPFWHTKPRPIRGFPAIEPMMF